MVTHMHENIYCLQFDPVAELIRATEADVSHLPPPNTHGINRKSLLLKVSATICLRTLVQTTTEEVTVCNAECSAMQLSRVF